MSEAWLLLQSRRAASPGGSRVAPDASIPPRTARCRWADVDVLAAVVPPDHIGAGVVCGLGPTFHSKSPAPCRGGTGTRRDAPVASSIGSSGSGRRTRTAGRLASGTAACPRAAAPASLPGAALARAVAVACPAADARCTVGMAAALPLPVADARRTGGMAVALPPPRFAGLCAGHVGVPGRGDGAPPPEPELWTVLLDDVQRADRRTPRREDAAAVFAGGADAPRRASSSDSLGATPPLLLGTNGAAGARLRAARLSASRVVYSECRRRVAAQHSLHTSLLAGGPTITVSQGPLGKPAHHPAPAGGRRVWPWPQMRQVQVWLCFGAPRTDLRGLSAPSSSTTIWSACVSARGPARRRCERRALTLCYGGDVPLGDQPPPLGGRRASGGAVSVGGTWLRPSAAGPHAFGFRGRLAAATPELSGSGDPELFF